MEGLSKADVFSKLRDFIYYFLKKIEERFKYLLTILEKTNDPNRPTSTTGDVLASAGSLVPFAGKAVSNVIKKGDAYISQKLDKRTALALSEIVYEQRNDICKQTLRKILIKAAYEIFCCYQKQFMEFTCESGSTGAAQALGFDAAQRFVNFLTENEVREIDERLVIKSIVFETPSFINNFKQNAKETTRKIRKIFKKVGLYYNNTCYKNENSNAEKYGYRQKFLFETIESINAEWQVDDSGVHQQQTVYLNDFDTDFPIISNYIISQNSEEFAMLDRQNKFEQNFELITDIRNTLLENIRVQHEETQNKFSLASKDLNSEIKEQAKFAKLDRNLNKGEIVQIVQEVTNDLLEDINRKHKETRNNLVGMCEQLTIEQRKQQDDVRYRMIEIKTTLEEIMNNLPKEENTVFITNSKYGVKDLLEDVATPYIATYNMFENLISKLFED